MAVGYQGLRAYFNMTKSDTGVLILDIAPLVPAAALVRKGDVLLSVDGLRVQDWGRGLPPSTACAH